MPTDAELRKLFKNGSEQFFRANASDRGGAEPVRRNPVDCPVPVAVVERRLRHGPLATRQTKGVDSRRFLVRVKSFRRRLLDEDNLCEKYVVDCCRYAGIIPGDAPGTTSIETSQEKVRSKAEERTEVIITEIPAPLTAQITLPL